MHCCNINKSRRGDFFGFTWYMSLEFIRKFFTCILVVHGQSPTCR